VQKRKEILLNTFPKFLPLTMQKRKFHQTFYFYKKQSDKETRFFQKEIFLYVSPFSMSMQNSQYFLTRLFFTLIRPPILVLNALVLYLMVCLCYSRKKTLKTKTYSCLQVYQADYVSASLRATQQSRTFQMEVVD
jgi:hypothetical protein